MDQLAIGGVLFAPVGVHEQQIQAHIKDENGNIQVVPHFPVRFIPLTDKDSQYSDNWYIV